MSTLSQSPASTVGVCASLLVIFALLRFFVRSHSVSHLRGPSSASWLLGLEYEWASQKEVGELENNWFSTYGSVIKLKSYFGRDALLIADPKALKYILQISHYGFPKTNETTARFNAVVGGKSMLASTGGVHQRQRRVLLPTFTTGQLKTFLDVFHVVGDKLCFHVGNTVSSGGAEINVLPWVARAALDIIGETAFEHKFNAFEPEGQQSELGMALGNIFTEASLNPAKSALLHMGLLRTMPTITTFLEYLPSRQYDRLGKFFTAALTVAQEIIKKRERDVAIDDGSDKDALSVLMRANRAENPGKRLSDDELISQLCTLIIAGHETTSTTVSWLLHDLSQHLKEQSLLRDEIFEHHRSTGRKELEASDYDSMPRLNAAIKESLRLHPVVHSLTRYAKHDDVLPLAEPLQTDRGTITELPVLKGQVINISIYAYNRLTSVWGSDANEWNPSRWMDEKKGMKQTGVGMTSNLLTFSGGLQGCIGWRFAMMEAQALVARLVGNFEFTPAESKHDSIRHIPVGRTSAPMLMSEIQAGPQVPLHVRMVSDLN